MGADARVGATLGGGTYLLEAHLGGGGMGTVYRARNVRTDGQFAIKVLLPEHSGSPETLRRFHNEARSAARLQNPHIVNVFDFNVDEDGTAYIVMEVLKGEDLEHRLSKTRTLPLPQVIALAKQVGSALQAAHEANIIHRDIKPGNIFLVKQELADQSIEIAKVLDFGIAKVRDDLTGKTRPNTVLGTPEYMSPEAAFGLTDQVDARTDEWSLAVVVYRALSGQLPFQADNLPRLLEQIRHAPHPSLCALGLPLPRYVSDAVDIALSKHQVDRFASVKEFVQALTDESIVAKRQQHLPPSRSLLPGPPHRETVDLAPGAVPYTVALAADGGPVVPDLAGPVPPRAQAVAGVASAAASIPAQPGRALRLVLLAGFLLLAAGAAVLLIRGYGRDATSVTPAAIESAGPERNPPTRAVAPRGTAVASPDSGAAGPKAETARLDGGTLPDLRSPVLDAGNAHAGPDGGAGRAPGTPGPSEPRGKPRPGPQKKGSRTDATSKPPAGTPANNHSNGDLNDYDPGL